MHLRSTSAFHPSDEDYGIYLDGITSVYMKIKDGLAAPYDIVIFDPTHPKAFTTEGAGYVRPTRSIVQQGTQTRAVSPIRQLLRVPVPDEMNHEPWTGYDAVGRIHLSLGLVFEPQPPADHVARTIVHEASHKFARTTDVLYKQASFAKSSQRDVDADPPVEVKMSIGGKTLTPMAGATKKGERISPHLYLENADSYAWTARRIWKRFGRGT